MKNDIVPWLEPKYRQQFEQWLELHVPNALWTVYKETDLTYLVRGVVGKQVYYGKAVTSISRGEAKLSVALAVRHPKQVPEVVQINAENNWILMRGIEGQALRDIPDQSRYEAAIREYGRLQREECENIDTFLNYGILDRRPLRLKDEINACLEEMCHRLEQEERVSLVAMKEKLLEMCDELATGLPMSLDHGDLHGGNIFWRNNPEDICIFDWGDTMVTHPFFSVRVFWNTLFDLLPEEDESAWYEKITIMRPIYLEAWQGIVSQEILDRHLLIAEELGCVYRALSWHLHITKKRSNSQESKDKPAQWLKLLLTYRKIKQKYGGRLM